MNAYSGGLTVRWFRAFGADGYHLELATDPAFENKVQGCDPKDGGHVFVHDVSGLDSGTYFVRVLAYSSASSDG